jgi:hypothetical protein
MKAGRVVLSLHEIPTNRRAYLTKTFTELDITVEALDAHLRDSGLVPYKVQPDGISLRTENGIGYFRGVCGVTCRLK